MNYHHELVIPDTVPQQCCNSQINFSCAHSIFVTRYVIDEWNKLHFANLIVRHAQWLVGGRDRTGVAGIPNKYKVF